MKLSEIEIKNFRKLQNVTISLGDATFLIGANNAGKTSTLEAINLLLSAGKLTNSHRSKYIDANGQEVSCQEDVIISGLFTNVQPSILNERGFNADRLLCTTDEQGNVTYSFRYRIRLSADGKMHYEMQLHPLDFKTEYQECTTWQQFVDLGVPASSFEGKELSKKLKKTDIEELKSLCPSLFTINAEQQWFENPGGIASNVASKLPRFLHIEASVLSEEMDASKTGTLHSLLSFMFEDVRSKSENYQKAVEALEALSREMDPNVETGAFGQLMNDLNKVVDHVFPNASIQIDTSLTQAESLKPIFGVSMTSNISTDISHQGTGLIRSAVFALLRFYKERTESDLSRDERGLIIGFEEPELFLHPKAAENMRNVIYDLASQNSQIVATTHSPYMIDLSVKPKQVLNSYSCIEHEFTQITAFNLSQAFMQIHENDKMRVKMIQKIDDYVSRVFFARKVILVEGDTEDIVFKKTISVMPEEVRKEISATCQVIKATGKATMVSFIKYLKALNVDLFVVHDEDSHIPGAEVMNEPILQSLGGDDSKRLMLHDCIEDQLGYPAPSSDKPYRAYMVVNRWTRWSDVPSNWKEKVKIIFSDFADRL